MCVCVCVCVCVCGAMSPTGARFHLQKISRERTVMFSERGSDPLVHRERIPTFGQFICDAESPYLERIGKECWDGALMNWVCQAKNLLRQTSKYFLS